MGARVDPEREAPRPARAGEREAEDVPHGERVRLVRLELELLEDERLRHGHGEARLPPAERDALGRLYRELRAPGVHGSAQLAVEATEGVSLGWGEPRFPVPVTETLIFEKLELQAHEADALTVGDILRFSLPRASGPRRFTLRIDAGAHATVRGLTLSE